MSEYRLNQQGQQVQEALDKALALGPATSSRSGTMSASDKSKLDSMNPVAMVFLGDVIETI